MSRRRSFLLPALATAVIATSTGLSAEELPDIVPVQVAAIQAPETVDPGARVTVLFAEAPDGRVELWGPTDEVALGDLILAVAVVGGQASITAPSSPGSYRLIHVGPNGRRLGTAVMDVSAVPITLAADTPIGAGASLQVRWRGPGAPGDRLQLVDPGDETVLSEVPALAITPGDLTLTVLPPPGRSGLLQLRYVTADGSVLQRLQVPAN